MTTIQDQKKRCFVISPIGEDKSAVRDAADKVLKHLIIKGLGPEFHVERADADSNPGSITPRMVASILEADLIVADLSGENPNVFYEVAIAHGYRKPTVHIQRAGEHVPFDIKDMRTIRYNIADPDELEKNQKTLRDYALAALLEGEDLVTPLSSAQRFASVQNSADPIVQSNVQVLEALSEIRSDMGRLLRRGTRTLRRTGNTAVPTPAQNRADRLSITGIIGNVVVDGRMKPEDFRHAITSDTSPGFDEWVRRQLAALIPAAGKDELDAILLHSDFYDEEEGQAMEDDERRKD